MFKMNTTKVMLGLFSDIYIFILFYFYYFLSPEGQEITKYIVT